MDVHFIVNSPSIKVTVGGLNDVKESILMSLKSTCNALLSSSSSSWKAEDKIRNPG